MIPILLASSSEIRATLLRRALVPFNVRPARVDEAAIKSSLLNEQIRPRDIADALAEAKALKVSMKEPDRLVLGCDQVLDIDGALLSKPVDKTEALAHLQRLRGKVHTLYSAAVICDAGKPVWRHVGVVRLTMRKPGDQWLADYVERNFLSIQHAVGCYKLEEEGARLFTRIEGNYFNVLGMPLLEILDYLILRGTIEE